MSESQGQGSVPGTSIVSEGVLNIAEAMTHTKLSKPELYKLMSRGVLVYVKYGKRRMIPKRALDELLARHLQGGVGK